jgi:hypothetical protein
MKIIGTTKLTTPCIWTCIGKGIEGFARLIGAPVTIYDQADFIAGRLQPDNDKIIFIFEAGFAQAQHTGWSIADLKRIWPNSTFVALSSDSIIWLKQHGRDQLDYSYVDLLLDVEDESINHYKSQGVLCDRWLWTTSNWMINHIEQYKYAPRTFNTQFDFILVANMGGDYRTRLQAYIQQNGYSLTNGGGCGHDDNDLTRLFDFYKNSCVTLGTTSHNNPIIRGMKGFRDWIGPLLGAPLIYDNYPQAMYSYGSIVPYYGYNDFASLISLYNKIQNKSYKQFLIEQQTHWIYSNTIDEQLFRILLKHAII